MIQTQSPLTRSRRTARAGSKGQTGSYQENTLLLFNVCLELWINVQVVQVVLPRIWDHYKSKLFYTLPF